MSSNIYNIEKPLIKDKQWLIFPKSTFSQIETMDCNDAMEGKCYTDKSLPECIQYCKDSPECNFGYYISDISKENNICVTLRDANIDSNPMYRLRTQSIYPEMDGTNSTVFINKNKYPFPPEKANIVFFMDNFLIENLETKKLLETSPLSYSDSNPYNSTRVGFEKDGDLVVQALQIPPDLSAGTEYVSIKYGDLLAFNIPTTTLVMRPTHHSIKWVTRSFSLSEHSSFFLRPLTPGREMGDEVRYSDTFSIHYSVSIVSIDKNSSMKCLYESHSNTKNKGEYVTFRFIPKVKGWYCNIDAQCTEIPLEKMIINDKGIGTYDGIAIGRNPGCWGVCKYKIKNQPHLKNIEEYKEGKSSNIVWYILIPVVLIFTAIILIRKH
jgi:hypothetical protein